MKYTQKPLKFSRNRCHRKLVNSGTELKKRRGGCNEVVPFSLEDPCVNFIFFTFSFLFSFTIPLHISLYILIYTLHIIYHIHNFSLNLIQLTVFSCYATLALVILVRA